MSDDNYTGPALQALVERFSPRPSAEDIDAKLDNIIDRVNNLRKRIDDLEDLVRALTP